MLDNAAFLGLLGVLLTVVGGIIVAIIARIRRGPPPVAVSASAISKLTKSVTSLVATVDDVREQRRIDLEAFEQEVDEIRANYKELEQCNARAIESLKLEYEKAIRDMRNDYESRIERMEQAHKDRVISLKHRIKALETLQQNGL